MTTFITRLDIGGTGPRLAVKDLIDMEGVPTTAGCRAVADDAKPAERDAACMAGARAAGVPIVGKTNLHELAFGASGVNRAFGTPVNQLDPSRVLVPGVDPTIDTAVDRVLAAAGLDVQPVRLPGWDQAFAMGGVILLAEAWAVDHHLLERGDRVGDDVATRLRAGEHITDEQVEPARAVQAAWRAELADVFTRVELLAMPTLVQFPPTFEESDDVHLATLTMAWNVAGVPVL